MSVALDNADWLTLAQAIACDAIETLVPVTSAGRFRWTGESGTLRLWLGPFDKHTTAWADIDVDGTVTLTRRSHGRRLSDDVPLESITAELTDIVAWLASAQPLPLPG